jgi:hypothetical protein
MPFFFIVPLWLIAIVFGTILLFVKNLRWLATYVFCCSTIGLALSFFLSLLLLMTSAKVLSGTKFAWLSLLIYLAGIAIGGVVGVLGAIPISLKINRKLGLRQFIL